MDKDAGPAEPAETDDDESDDDDEDVVDDDAVIASSEKEDRVIVDEMIQDRRDQIDTESSKVLGRETISNVLFHLNLFLS